MLLRKWVVRGLVLLVLCGCLGAGVLYQQWTNPTAVRQQVVEMLEKQFPGATVTLDSARLRLLGGVVLTELRLLRRGGDKGQGGGEAPDILHIPQATVYLDKERIHEGQVPVRRIELLRPRIRVVRGRDGKWNIEGLTGNSDSRAPLPTIVIQQGTLVFEDNFAGPFTWELHDLNLTLVNDAANCLGFRGGAQSEITGAVDVRGVWNRVTNATSASLYAANISITQPLVRYGASQIDKLKGLHLEGKAEMATELAYQPGAQSPLAYNVRCNLRQIKVDHPKLPAPLHNLSAVVSCDGAKVVLEKLKAAAGQGRIECHGWADLADIEKTFAAELTAHHMPLTMDLVKRMPPQAAPMLQKLHELFHPAGAANARIIAEKRNGAWVRGYCTLQPEDLSICFDKFRYPVDHLAGEVDFDWTQFASKWQFVGYSGPQPITFRGTWKGKNADPATEATIEVAGYDLPLDDKLLRALDSDATRTFESLAKSFHPVGRGNFQALIRRVPGNDQFQNTYHVQFVDCGVKWDEFPYPLEKVSGDLVIHPGGHCVFHNFRGAHHGGEVYVAGQRLPRSTGPHDGKLIVEITGRDVCLDGDLRTALVPFGELSKTWDAFNPAGRLDFQVRVEQAPGKTKDMDITVDVAGCAIEPSFFEYALHDLTGRFRYHNNKVDLANFTARHNNSLVSIEKGTVDVVGDRGFYAKLENLVANPVLADDDFLEALPQALRNSAEAINLKNQAFAIHAKEIVVSQTADPGKPATPPVLYWDGQVYVEDASLRTGIDINQATGVLSCRGLHDGKHLVNMTGNVFLSEAKILKQDIRGVRSHFVVSDQTPDVVHFDLKAPIFDGDVSGQGRLEFGSLLRYEVDLTASRIQLEKFGQQNLGSNHQLAGLAGGRLHLHGTGGKVADLEGNGTIDIPYSPTTRILNLPLLLDLLKFLGLRVPDRTFFEEAHAEFAITGNRVSVNKLDMLGNVISLYGKGEVNIDGTDLQLDMYPSWGRAEQLLPPMMRAVPSVFSKQLLKVEMRGKLGGKEDDLKITKRLMPGLMDRVFGKSW